VFLSITSTKEGDVVVNQIGKALVDRIVRAASEGKRFRVVVVIPEVPGFAGDVKNEGSLKIIMAAQYRSINRGGNSIYEKIRNAGYEPYVPISRSWDRRLMVWVKDGLYPLLPFTVVR
jgi:phospholipase D1/2